MVPKLKRGNSKADRFDHIADVAAWGTIVLFISSVTFLVGIITGAWLAPNISEKPWAYEYQGLIGAIFTIVAAAIAWFAVNRQITTQLLLANSEKKEARDFIIYILYEYMRLADLAWLQVDLILSDTSDQKLRTKLVGNIVLIYDSMEREFNASSAARDMTLNYLSIYDRFQLDEIMRKMKDINIEISNFRDLYFDKNNKYDVYLSNFPNQARVSFSWLHHECKKFDESLASIFSKRTRLAVHDDPMSMMLGEVFDKHLG